MLTLVFAVLACLAASAPAVRAQTAVPEVASRCLLRERDEGGTLQNCTLAIESGQMSVELLALMHNVRGEAHCQQSDYALALADQDEAIRLVPNFPQAIADRTNCGAGQKDPGAPSGRGNPTGRGEVAVPATASRCLLDALDPGGPLQNCTEAVQDKTMSSVLLALIYNARGLAHCRRGEHDLALADVDEAIRLVPNFAQAYVNRASCHLAKGDTRSGLEDYAHAIRLAPMPGYFRDRAKIYNWIGEHDLALADYDTAIAMAPRFNEAMFERGMTLFNLGRFEEAAKELTAVIRATPGDPYPILWLHIARLRAAAPDSEEFRAGMKTLDLTAWPAPLFDLFLGNATIDGVRRASVDDPEGPAVGECVTALFDGEYQLGKGHSDAAIQPIEEAASICPRNENRYLTAWAELKRLAPATKQAGPW